MGGEGNKRGGLCGRPGSGAIPEEGGYKWSKSAGSGRDDSLNNIQSILQSKNDLPIFLHFLIIFVSGQQSKSWLIFFQRVQFGLSYRLSSPLSHFYTYHSCHILDESLMNRTHPPCYWINHQDVGYDQTYYQDPENFKNGDPRGTSSH